MGGGSRLSSHPKRGKGLIQVLYKWGGWGGHMKLFQRSWGESFIEVREGGGVRGGGDHECYMYWKRGEDLL